MNTKKAVRVALDALLTVMIIAEMFIQFTGVFLHEVIGFAFFATVATHLILSAKWIKNTAGAARLGTMNTRRKVLAVMGILLAINMVVLGASSVAISTILASAGLEWTLGPYAVWSAIHSVSSYTLCALVTVHLGMHWAFLASALRVPYNPSRRRAINAGVNAVAAAGALALGVLAVNQVAPIIGGNGSGNSNGNGNGYGYGANSGNGETSSDGSGSSSGSGSSPENAGGTRQRKGKTKGNSGFFSGSSSSPSDSGSTGSSGSSSSSSAPSGPSTQDSNSSSGATGICTLCRKQCPLSDPKCNKPYSAGLL